MFFTRRQAMITADQALPGRHESILPEPETHAVYGIDVHTEPAGSQVAYVALGCFWGAEKLYWETDGVVNTAVGYQGGFSPNPTYMEVCSALTGHTETVKIVFDPERVSYEALLRIFFENHDPTAGMRQGNDVGTQYRSAIFTTDNEQQRIATHLRDEYQAAFTGAGYGTITTEIKHAPEFYYAEAEHQQYLIKVPGGYCPNHATGVTCG